MQADTLFYAQNVQDVGGMAKDPHSAVGQQFEDAAETPLSTPYRLPAAQAQAAMHASVSLP